MCMYVKYVRSVVVDSLFYAPPIVCGGSVFGLCFVMHSLVSILVLQSSLQDGASWLLHFNCLPDVL